MKSSLILLVCNRILIVIVALLGSMLTYQIIPDSNYGNPSKMSIFQGSHSYIFTEPTNPLIEMWSVWDSKWYISIAEDGYSAQHRPYKKIDNKGFLPLYAIIIGILSKIIFFGNTPLAGIFVANICLLLALFFLVKLARLEFGTDESFKEKDMVLYLILFPTSYYLSAIYPESLFLLLSILVFYFIKKEKIFLASLLISLACITKVFGLFLCIPLILYIWRKRKEIPVLKYSVASFFITISFPIAYFTHMYLISGDALAYVHIQKTFFGHTWEEPLKLILQSIFEGKMHLLWNCGFIIFSLIVIGKACTKIPVAYTFFALACILFTPFTGIVEGSSRYLGTLFVLPLALAVVVKNQDIKNLIIMLFCTIQGFSIFWWLIGAGFAS